jgi:hypothetical protein
MNGATCAARSMKQASTSTRRAVDPLPGEFFVRYLSLFTLGFFVAIALPDVYLASAT